jgi:hypothetical protein
MPHNGTHMQTWALVGAYVVGFLAFHAYLRGDWSLPASGVVAAASAADLGSIPEPEADDDRTLCPDCGTSNRSEQPFVRCRECTTQLPKRAQTQTRAQAQTASD